MAKIQAILTKREIALNLSGDNKTIFECDSMTDCSPAPAAFCCSWATTLRQRAGSRILHVVKCCIARLGFV
jgi:hypothetical protein